MNIQIVTPEKVWINGALFGSLREVLERNEAVCTISEELVTAICLYVESVEGTADNRATLAAISATDMQVEKIRQERDAAIAENIELKRKLIPPLGPIVEGLRKVGLYDWMAEAAKIDPNLLDEIAALAAAAAAGDVSGVTSKYAEIAEVHSPTVDRLQLWQSVLDAAGVPPQILSFIPQGASTSP
jgi:hypothetical protein